MAPNEMHLVARFAARMHNKYFQQQHCQHNIVMLQERKSSGGKYCKYQTGLRFLPSSLLTHKSTRTHPLVYVPEALKLSWFATPLQWIIIIIIIIQGISCKVVHGYATACLFFNLLTRPGVYYYHPSIMKWLCEPRIFALNLFQGIVN